MNPSKISISIFFLVLNLWSPCQAAPWTEEPSVDPINCDLLHGFEGAEEIYLEDNCQLLCRVKESGFSTEDNIHDGHPCPLNQTGICHNGKCISSNEQSLYECSRIHSLNFQTHRSVGTDMDNCTLTCVIESHTLSITRINLDDLQCQTTEEPESTTPTGATNATTLEPVFGTNQTAGTTEPVTGTTQISDITSDIPSSDGTSNSTVSTIPTTEGTTVTPGSGSLSLSANSSFLLIILLILTILGFK